MLMNFTEAIKKFWKPFVFIFLVVFLIINWQEISLFFNYKVIYGKLQTQEPDSFENESTVLENTISIPKIEEEAPIVFTESTDNKDFQKYLKEGVLHYPDSALPGEQGRAIILGHSAPEGWPDINYDRIFTDLNKLAEGDEIYVCFNNRQYVYRVTNKFFLDRGEELPSGLTNSKSVLILLSCWPPGKDLYRIAVEAVLD